MPEIFLDDPAIAPGFQAIESDKFRYCSPLASVKKANLADVPVEHRCSPKGKFELRRQHVSLALGGVKDVGTWGGGHPFDIERVSLPPGKVNFPLHAHASQTEHYIILSGVGLIRDGEDGEERLVAGDHVICHPGDAHQIENDGPEPLEYYVIADHCPAEVAIYPKTGKRFLRPEYRVVKIEEADYYEGEE